jgi:EmrB/QacA subfamily drug resistance transporter
VDRKWWTLLVSCAAIFMLLLDVTIVNVALPSIERDLGSDFSDLQWVIDAYALTLAGFVLAAGSLADMIGRKVVFMLGLAVFTASSLSCGLALDPLFLNVSRGAQGIGAAMMFGTSLALIAQEFQGRERGTALGIWGATTAAAVSFGPLVGGALVDALSWRWIFLVNVPIGLAALVVARLRLRESRDPGAAGVDLRGVAVFCPALFLLVYALIRGTEEGWGSALIISCFAASALILVLFVVVELRAAHALLDLSLFRKPAFTGATIVAFTLAASIFSMFLYITLFFQNVLGFSPFEAGLRSLPVTGPILFVSPLSGRLTARVPVRLLLGTGLAFVAVGLLLMGNLSDSSGWTAVLPGQVLAGIGIGLATPGLASTAVGVVSPQLSGMASGANNTARQLGLATGIGGLGSIFQARIESTLAPLVGAHVRVVARPRAFAGCGLRRDRARLAGGAARRPRQGSGRCAPRVRDGLQHDRAGERGRGGSGLPGGVCARAATGLRGRGQPGGGCARARAGGAGVSGRRQRGRGTPLRRSGRQGHPRREH